VEYLIGRDPDPSQPRIVLEDKSVSRTHGKLAVLGSDRYLIEDMRSQNGTFLRAADGWKRVERAQVGADDEVRLGAFITTVAALLQRAVGASARIKIERNPETGEIVKRKNEP